MKIALCLSGHLRTFEKTYAALYKNLLQYYNTDVFISTWETLGTPNSKFASDDKYVSIRTEDYLSRIESVYEPKLIDIEESNGYKRFFDQGDKIKIHNPGDVYFHPGYQLSMFYKIARANSLKSQWENQNGFKYDMVIRARPDLYFDSKIELGSPNYITIPFIGSYSGANDQFAFSNSGNMDKYSSLYANVDRYCLIEKCRFKPEFVMRYHLQRIGVPLVEAKNINYKILRLNNQVTTQDRLTQNWMQSKI